eukprot:TRINITY_DN43013_c0_g1_i1.p4 TRINITY_DN43013_c0_g1~~TRINITY_DN43013_c0_g1_i1.p4  ORF type:complete len:103 (+),score=21.63 TRINITY_DN43013_c0_g1_i1:74-382(+)
MIRPPPRSTLSSSSAASDVYKRQGLTYNYSKGGMYVKMEAKLNPENYYLIKMLNYSSEAKGPEKHRVIDARVRWSKRAESYAGLEHGYYYGYGFEYSSPVVY